MEMYGQRETRKPIRPFILLVVIVVAMYGAGVYGIGSIFVTALSITWLESCRFLVPGAVVSFSGLLAAFLVGYEFRYKAVDHSACRGRKGVKPTVIWTALSMCGGFIQLALSYFAVDFFIRGVNIPLAICLSIAVIVIMALHVPVTKKQWRAMFG